VLGGYCDFFFVGGSDTNCLDAQTLVRVEACCPFPFREFCSRSASLQSEFSLTPAGTKILGQVRILTRGPGTEIRKIRPATCCIGEKVEVGATDGHELYENAAVSKYLTANYMRPKGLFRVEIA
jgi:hypothetical protein